MKISVAMATYNGERFVRDQLESLAAQTRLPDELVVSDDCSTDNTIAVIEDFARTAPFTVRIHRNPRNLGFSDNFLHAASLCSGDWIAFCDQDDIWLPEKLAVCERQTAIPRRNIVVVAHNAEIVDERLIRSGVRYLNLNRTCICSGRRLPNLWVASGFTMLFRSDLLSGISCDDRGPDPGVPTSRLAHDVWICRIARIIGDVAIIPDCLALYRRHATTTTNFLSGGNQSVRESKKVRRQIQFIAMSGSATYRAHSDAAAHQAQAFERLARDQKLSKWRVRFKSAAIDYAALSKWCMIKSRVYGEKSLYRRVTSLSALFLMNGYLRFNGYSWMNVRKMIKEMLIDVIVAVHGPSRVTDNGDSVAHDSREHS